MLDDLLSSSAGQLEGIIEAPSLIAGRWCRPDESDAGLVERVGPYLRRVVSRAPVAGASDVDQARAYARAGARVVAALAPAARATVLERASRLAAEHRDELARILAFELGKPIRDSAGELDRVSDTFAVCAAEARQIGGDMLPVAGWQRGVGHTAMTYRAPAGVALAITPFNAPANLLAHKLGASFAAGNTTLVKAPPQAPASSLAVVALLLEAGLPLEAVQLLHGGGEVGALLCAAPEVAVVSFTGSVPSGHAVARAAAGKRLVLELGGNAATIVCEDADIAHAARICARTGYSNSGQSCISVQRVYVHEDRYDAFLDAFTESVQALVVGDPLDPRTDVGSMVDDEAAERVQRWSLAAAANGAQIRCGGERDGATLRPTVVAGPRPDDDIVRNEAFGAAVAVMPYTDFDKVLDHCNDSRFGLQAGLFTQDVSRIFTTWARLDVGGLIVNGSSNFRLDHVPFGGVKDSGFGREAPRQMIEDYTVIKTLILRDVSIWGTQR